MCGEYVVSLPSEFAVFVVLTRGQRAVPRPKGNHPPRSFRPSEEHIAAIPITSSALRRWLVAPDSGRRGPHLLSSLESASSFCWTSRDGFIVLSQRRTDGRPRLVTVASGVLAASVRSGASGHRPPTERLSTTVRQAHIPPIRDPVLAATSAATGADEGEEVSLMRRLISGFAVAAVLVGVLAGPAGAASHGRTVVAHINGGGTAEMQVESFAQGITHWGAGVTLYSDGTASGQIDCVDQRGSSDPGNIFGKVTSWSGDLSGGPITLNVVGKFVGFGGHPEDVTFKVIIQEFGGAGVGRWTLEVEVAPGVFFEFCVELVTSGQIVLRLA